MTLGAKDTSIKGGRTYFQKWNFCTFLCVAENGLCKTIFGNIPSHKVSHNHFWKYCSTWNYHIFLGCYHVLMIYLTTVCHYHIQNNGVNKTHLEVENDKIRIPIDNSSIFQNSRKIQEINWVTDNDFSFIQGDPNQNFKFVLAIAPTICRSDPMFWAVR